MTDSRSRVGNLRSQVRPERNEVLDGMLCILRGLPGMAGLKPGFLITTIRSRLAGNADAHSIMTELT